jgi:hypothetical protein
MDIWGLRAKEIASWALIDGRERENLPYICPDTHSPNCPSEA